MTEKTEEATPKRLRQARKEGDSPISAFATQSVAFLAAVALAPLSVAALAARSTDDLRNAIDRAAEAAPVTAFDPAPLAFTVVVLTVPILAAAGVVGAVASVVQAGGVIATKKLSPSLERLDVVSGMKQLLSPTRAVAVARALLFGGAVAWLACGELYAHAGDLARTTGRLPQAGALAGVLALAVVKRAAIAGLLLAVVDLVVTRRSWLERLRMSKADVQREHKESEGDPQLKAARDRAHQELLAAATVANVRRASVVVVNPVHIACAIRYDEEAGDEAPVVVAAGQGDLAAQIVEAARRYGVPVLQDIPLARALVELEVGTSIPEALYEAVAEILREAWETSPDEASDR